MNMPHQKSPPSPSGSEKYDDVKHLEGDESPLPQVAHLGANTKVTDALNAAYEAAKIQAPLNPLSRESIALYGCAGVSFLCSCGNGYDTSLMTGINGMPRFKENFNNGDKAQSTSIIFSIYTIGQIAGSLIADKIADRWGRRAGMFAGCLTILCGTAIITTSHAVNQFLAGRFILGMGIAIAITSAPVYCIEIAPPQWRGRMTALYNTGWSGGAIPAAAVVFGTQTMKSNWSYRIPLLLQAVPAGLVCCIVWFLPESPRWLYQNGRDQEALDFLIKYHGNKNPDSIMVKLEMQEFRDKIALDGTDKRWWDYSALVKTKNARWRSLMVFMMGLFGQMSGNGLGYYNLDIYKSLGFDRHMQFSMNLIGVCTAAICSWVAVSLSDRMPRRKVLVWGTLGCSILLGCNAGLSAKWASYGAEDKNLDVGRLAAAFFFLFGCLYAFTYTPLQSLYPAECLETTARAKGVSMKIMVISLTSFINLYCIPIGLANIQWRFLLVFVFWDFFESIMWYFFCVETLGRTLEELDEVFSAPNPVAASKIKRKIAVTESGDVVHVDSV